jgi:hypothetical protein
VVLDWAERALDAMGWRLAALVLPKRLRRLLFPQTRPRGGGPAMDRPVDVGALAAHMERTARGTQTLERRLAIARGWAERVEVLRRRLARDANGNCVVEHHRGTRSRGSNAFMAAHGVDGLLVLGHQRTNPVDIAGAMLAIGQVADVVDGSPWGDVAGELPHVDGTTRTVRWRGYRSETWAAMARALNRADLEQVAARARPTLAAGVPLLVVAAEPCGLPLADPPARMPAGVAEVVEAVRELAAGRPEGAEPAPAGDATPATVTGTGGNLGNLDTGTGGDSIGQRSIGRTVPVFYRTLADRNSPVAMGAIVARLGIPERTARRALTTAVAMGLLAREGAGRWTRYRVPVPVELVGPPPAPVPVALATGVAEPATVDVVRWPDTPVGAVGGHLAGAPPAKTDEANVSSSVSPPRPPEIVPPAPSSGTPAEISPAPTPREPNTPKTGMGRRPTGPKRPPTTPVAAPAAGARGRDAEPTGGLPRYRFPANAPRLTGQARDAMVAELRQHLRAVAFNARLDHMAGHERDALAVDEVLALFADPPPPVARGP